MAVLISCPSCGNQGELPDGGLGQVLLTCRQCGVKFSPFAEAPATPTPPAAPVPPLIPTVAAESVGVWVGTGLSAAVDPVAVEPPRAAPPVVELQPAPPLTLSDLTPETAAAHLDWLKAETDRFQAFVDRQLTALMKMREQVTAAEAKARADTVRREQALNRERTVLDARSADLARRETELAATLTRQGDELAAELDRAVATERDHLAKRADELALMEYSLQQRMAEVMEMEQTLRGELDLREAEVERQRREVEEVAYELRTRTPPPVGTLRQVRPAPTPSFPCG
jgi:hypothetical protein